jgi:hypothetical protein
MPEIMDHLKKHGDRGKLQFTGHSLGGSLSLLVHLMLLSRKVVSPSTLKPVVTFGSPFVFCGGQKLIDELGVDESHIHCVMMHRDIVPRAFSCNYPDHVAVVLKRLNRTFRSHPCLTKNVSYIHVHMHHLASKIMFHIQLISLDIFRSYCTRRLEKYSFSNRMRRHRLRTLYSLQKVPSISLIIPYVVTHQKFSAPF